MLVAHGISKHLKEKEKGQLLCQVLKYQENQGRGTEIQGRRNQEEDYITPAVNKVLK